MKSKRSLWLGGMLALVFVLFTLAFFAPITVGNAAVGTVSLWGSGDAGTLDRTFGYTGRTTLQKNGAIRDIVSLSDGKSLLTIHQTNESNGPAKFIVVRYLADGSLDTSFGTNGIAEIDHPGTKDESLTLVADTQNRYLVGGAVRDESNSYARSDFAVVRLLQDGTVDTSFGNDGWFIADPSGGSEDRINDMTLYADGRILLAGSGMESGEISHMTVMRLTANGVPDNTFSSDGLVYLPTYHSDFYGYGDQARSIHLLPSGKILVGGTVSGAENAQVRGFGAAQLNDDGSFDTDFGVAGWTAAHFGSDGEGYTIVRYADGKFAIVGYANDPNATSARGIAIVRFLADGTLDPTFDEDGKLFTRLTTQDYASDLAFAAVLDTEERILAAGTSLQRFVTVRFLDDGTLDDTYGDGGLNIVPLYVPDYESPIAYSIAELPNDRFLVGGGVGTVAVLAQLHSNGTLDETFGGLGYAISTSEINTYTIPQTALQSDSGTILLTSPYFENDSPLERFLPNGESDPSFNRTLFPLPAGFGTLTLYDVAVQSDNKILVAGNWNNSNTVQNVAILYRFNADGTVDSNFGTNGYVVLNEEEYNRFTTIAIQPNGYLLAGGAAGAGDGDANRGLLARYTPSGEPDTTFGDAGIVLADFPAQEYQFDDMVVQPNGDIVVVEQTSQPNGILVAQFLSDGTLDTTFGTDGIVQWAANGPVSLARQPDGKLLVVGSLYQSEEYDFDTTVMRLTGNGVPDPGFGIEGVAVYDLSPRSESVYDVVVAPDGAIVLAGSISVDTPPYSGVLHALLMRLFTNGALNQSFGNGGYTYLDVERSQFTSVALQADGKIVAGGSVETWLSSNYSRGVVARYFYGDPVPTPTPTVTGTATLTPSSTPTTVPPTATPSSGNRSLWLPLIQR